MTDSYFPVLQVRGISAFTTDASLVGGPYEKLAARKFTFAPYGGYDGWDVYRTLTELILMLILKLESKGASWFINGTFTTFITTEGDDGITSDYYAFLEGFILIIILKQLILMYLQLQG